MFSKLGPNSENIGRNGDKTKKLIDVSNIYRLSFQNSIVYRDGPKFLCKILGKNLITNKLRMFSPMIQTLKCRFLVFSLQNRSMFDNLAVLIWHSFGTMFTLLKV